MSSPFLKLNVEFILPITMGLCEYFDTKYPCTDKNNDGKDMPLEDEAILEAYNFLLAAVEQNKDACKDGYERLKQLIESNKQEKDE